MGKVIRTQASRSVRFPLSIPEIKTGPATKWPDPGFELLFRRLANHQAPRGASVLVRQGIQVHPALPLAPVDVDAVLTHDYG